MSSTPQQSIGGGSKPTGPLQQEQATLSAIADRHPPTNIEPVLIGAMSSLRFHR